MAAKKTSAKPAGQMQTVHNADPMSHQDNVRDGIVIDGAVYPLEGQPPAAKLGAWWPPVHRGN